MIKRRDEDCNRGRSVMGLARGEARRLGHDFVGTGHVLLGLLLEVQGAAGRALQSLGHDAHRLGAAVEAALAVPCGTPQRSALPLSPRVKEVLDLAADEAAFLGHDGVGSGHVLLGMIRAAGGTAAHIVQDIYQIDLREARRAVEKFPD